jgi:hypothetical protein
MCRDVVSLAHMACEAHEWPKSYMTPAELSDETARLLQQTLRLRCIEGDVEPSVMKSVVRRMLHMCLEADQSTDRNTDQPPAFQKRGFCVVGPEGAGKTVALASAFGAAAFLRPFVYPHLDREFVSRIDHMWVDARDRKSSVLFLDDVQCYGRCEWAELQRLLDNGNVCRVLAAGDARDASKIKSLWPAGLKEYMDCLVVA